jgi:hypothetical protein
VRSARSLFGRCTDCRAVLLNSIFWPDFSTTSSVFRVSTLNFCWLARKSVDFFRICRASGAMVCDCAGAANVSSASAEMAKHRDSTVRGRLPWVEFMRVLLSSNAVRDAAYSPFSRFAPSMIGCHPETSEIMKTSIFSASGAWSAAVDL